MATLGRVALLGVMVGLIHLHHAQLTLRSQAQHWSQRPIALVQPFFPTADRWGDALQEGGQQVLNAQGDVLGQALQTSPQGDRFLGFSGPTNLLVVLTPEEKIAGVTILSSGDTREHVRQIERQGRFLQSWQGLSSAEIAQGKEAVEPVTGATLTSLAIMQALQARLGQAVVQGKFPAPPTIEQARVFFEQAATLKQVHPQRPLWDVQDATGQPIGELLSTSPAADAIIGYQGPTLCQIAMNEHGAVIGVAVLDSFDNEPYVTYVRDEAAFLELFRRPSLMELATLDPSGRGLDGVSGATMTSTAVVQGLIQAAAQELQERQAPLQQHPSLWSFSGRTGTTAGTVVFALILGLTRLRGLRWLRTLFRLWLVIVLGLMLGDLLSMAMFVGWSRSGIPWQNATGLCMLALAAFCVPVMARQNLYCSHLCPHGAAQQLLPRRFRYRGPLPRGVVRSLQLIRPLLLLTIVVINFSAAPVSLVHLEPFDAYSWRAAGWQTTTIAVGGLIASLFLPMGYCRYGCPTGAVLDYVRRHAQSHRFSVADGFSLVAILVGLILWRFPIS